MYAVSLYSILFWMLTGGLGGSNPSSFPAAAKAALSNGNILFLKDAATRRSPTSQRRKPRRTAWKTCLPLDVKKTDVVLTDAGQRLTVEKTLNGSKARCSGQKLLDAKNREIRFVHPLCWGNPPADAEEQQAAQQREIAELRKNFTVISLACDPLTQ